MGVSGYRVYNKLMKNNKLLKGKAYVLGTWNSKQEAKKKSSAINKRWNRFQKKKGEPYTAKAVKFKKIKLA